MTPTQNNTLVNVDWDNNGTTDASCVVNVVNICKFRDTTDNDSTGAHITATHPIAIVWGEDDQYADIGNPYIDAGYTILPQDPDFMDVVVTMDKTANPTIVAVDSRPDRDLHAGLHGRSDLSGGADECHHGGRPAAGLDLLRQQRPGELAGQRAKPIRAG